GAAARRFHGRPGGLHRHRHPTADFRIESDRGMIASDIDHGQDRGPATGQWSASGRTTRMKRLNMQAGFTLIEIMVVVFILGLLVTLVAPKIIGRTDQARQTKALADIRAIEEAMKLFK